MKYEPLVLALGFLVCAMSCEKDNDEPQTPEQEITADTVATTKPLPQVDTVPTLDTLPTVNTDTTPAPDTTTITEPPFYGLHLATKTNQERAAQEIRHFAYLTCYNYEWYIPNWVAYILTKDELNAVVDREGAFVPDPLAKGEKMNTSQYTNSGYDRGHMAPAADFKFDAVAMEECMYLSNICPQVPSLNRGRWLTLENKVRDWAAAYDSVLVIVGPVVKANYKTIGTMGVVVPEAFFKIVARMDGNGYKALCFLMPNEKCPDDIYNYCVTIDSVEVLTGHDFFHTLPTNEQNAIESAIDKSGWQ